MTIFLLVSFELWTASLNYFFRRCDESAMRHRRETRDHNHFTLSKSLCLTRHSGITPMPGQAWSRRMTEGFIQRRYNCIYKYTNGWNAKILPASYIFVNRCSKQLHWVKWFAITHQFHINHYLLSGRCFCFAAKFEEVKLHSARIDEPESCTVLGSCGAITLLETFSYAQNSIIVHIIYSCHIRRARNEQWMYVFMFFSKNRKFWAMLPNASTRAIPFDHVTRHAKPQTCVIIAETALHTRIQ